jgi:transcriptional regulator
VLAFLPVATGTFRTPIESYSWFGNWVSTLIYKVANGPQRRLRSFGSISGVTANDMYQPEHFRVHDLVQMHALIRTRPFAILVSAGSAGLYATHLPTVLKDDGRYGLIECHLARANPHWKDLASGIEALMIFQGTEGYITPSWYPSKTEHGKVVPTWNYSVVHVYGHPEVMEDKHWLRNHVTELTAQQESGRAAPWAVSDAPESFIETMLRGIVGFRLAIERIEGKWKMSQNRETRDREGVAKGLLARGEDDDLHMSELVSSKIAKGN